MWDRAEYKFRGFVESMIVLGVFIFVLPIWDMMMDHKGWSLLVVMVGYWVFEIGREVSKRWSR